MDQAEIDILDGLVDVLLPKAAAAYEACGQDFDRALDRLAGEVRTAWSARATPQVAGVVALLSLLVVEAREAYHVASGNGPYVVVRHAGGE
jgi:hypothetical protein